MKAVKGRVELIDKQGETLTVDAIDAREILAGKNCVYGLKHEPEAPMKVKKYKVRFIKDGNFYGKPKKKTDSRDDAENYIKLNGLESKCGVQETDA